MTLQQWQTLSEKDLDRFVFHYTGADTAINHILPTTSLRLGPLQAANDSREFGMKGFTFVAPDDLGKPAGHLLAKQMYNGDFHQLRKFADQLSDWLRKHIKIGCFALDSQAQTSDDPGYYRGYSKPAMWAHYADNHTGVCLVFEKAKLVNLIESKLLQNDSLMHGSVKYPKFGNSMRRLNALNLDRKQFRQMKISELARLVFNQSATELLLRKHPDWRSEREWRCLLLSDDTNPRIFNVSNALVGLVAGMNIAQKDILWLNDYCSRNGVTGLRLSGQNLDGHGYGSLQYLPIDKKSPGT